MGSETVDLLKPVVVLDNFRVVVHPDHSRYVGGTEREVCQRILAAIKRHVDEVDRAEVAHDRHEKCPACSYPWNPMPNGYNGCCNEHTVAFDKAHGTVYGMPRAAVSS